MTRIICTLVCICLFALASSESTVKRKSTSPAVSQTLRTFYKRQTGSTCECGVGTRKRIVGGNQAHQNAYPWLVAIYWTSGDLMCGGSIINPNFILSASHCFFPGVNAGDIFVVLGDYDRGTTVDGPATQMSIEKIITHEKFGIATKVDSDIALLKTTSTIVFSEKIQPICLPPPGENYIDQFGVVAGWGTTSFGGTESNMLLEIDAPILKDSICQANFTTFYNPSNMMCAGHLEGGKDACQGDSGGPLFLPDAHDIYTIAGVISFGRGCATPGYPGVYAKVTSFLPWISDNTAGSPVCHKPNKEPPASCGVANNPKRKKRIIGGINTSPNQYPWTAVLIVKSGTTNKLRCGATLISESWLLTSARCVYGVSISDMSVVLGEYDIAKYEGTEVQRLVSSVRIHPNFISSRSFTHDIALIELKSSVIFNEHISPVCLPPESWDEPSLLNVEGVATGWGVNSKSATVEQQVFMKIISNRNCRVSYGPYLTSTYLCAGGVKGEDICNFDFGGQFSVTSDDGLYRIVGISSFSQKDNCGNGHPAGFTRVTSYLNWIHQTAGLVIDVAE